MLVGLVVDEVGRPMVNEHDRPATTVVAVVRWRDLDELPPWPDGQPTHGRNDAYRDALQWQYVASTLKAAAAALDETVATIEAVVGDARESTDNPIPRHS